MAEIFAVSELAHWDSFYVIVGSAAGALIGLQFVVLTLIAANPPRRAAEGGAAFVTPTIVHFSTAFFLAALIPWLYLDQGPATANAVKQARIEQVYVPAGQQAAWKAAGLDARAFDAKQIIKLPVPGVRYRMDVASATTMPWIDANGWRIERGTAKVGHQTYYYETPRGKAVLAAAEAYAWGAEAVVHLDSQDLDAFGRMLAFLRSIDQPVLPQLVTTITSSPVPP